MERQVVRETIAGVILRGIVATVGLETTFNLLAEIEKEGKEVWVTPKGVLVDFPASHCKEKEIPLKEIRKAKGLTQEEMAKEIGVSFATVNRWEKGKFKPSPLSEKAIEEVVESSAAVVKENKYPSEGEQVVIARDAILSLLKDGKTHRKTTSLYKICKEKGLEYRPVWSAYTFLEKEGLLETTVIDRVKFATITPQVVAEPGTVILPSEGGVEKAKRNSPAAITGERMERIKEGILRNLALEKSPVMKSKFLRRTAEKEHLSFGPLWKACNSLIEEGKIHADRIHSRLMYISIPKEDTSPATPEKKPHEKKLYKGVENKYRSKSGLAIPESVEKCEEIILRYLNLSSSKPDGLPKEHLVALCMFENFAHSYARKAISNLIETGKAKFSMNDSQGVQVPFVTLNE